MESSGSGVPSEPVSDLIKEDVQPHPEKSDDSLSARFGAKLKEVVQGDENEPEQRRVKSGYEKLTIKKNREELSNLIVTVFVLGVALVNAPEEIKPMRSELEIVSDNLTEILIRHNIMTGKLSGDALNVISIIAVSASYYSRVAPYIRKNRGNNGSGPGPIGPSDQPGPDGASAEIRSPIESYSPSTAAFLDNVVRSPKDGE